MNIFNSLGSNYNLKSVVKILSAGNSKNYRERLLKHLEDKYSGKAVLVYKGREAISLALKSIGKSKEYTVGVCGFTCFAVFDAITKEGYKIEYLDIKKDELNFTQRTLENSLVKNPKLKIVIIQNTLGFPCDMKKISKFCKEKNIILIEDLAHSIGSNYESGLEAGAVGDFTTLSFSQDKMIDGVSGGALIIRNSKFKIPNLKFQAVSLKQQYKDKLYPLFTFLIRKTYSIGIGKAIHLFLKMSNLLSKPVDDIDSNSIHELPDWYTEEIYNGFKNIEKDLEHRRRIASIYSGKLSDELLSENICSQVVFSSNLRFPIFTQHRNAFVDFLRKKNVFISDIWYDAPIAPKKYLNKTDYQEGNCPNSEEISKNILNLPTHKNLSEKDARLIVDKINLWLKLQQN